MVMWMSANEGDILRVRVRASMGRSELGLCPTQNRLDKIGWWKISPVADRWSRQVRRIIPSWVADGLVGIIGLRKHQENGEEIARKR